MVDLTKRLCGNCGANPCYHLCFNSPYFYSPEQERYDDQFYGDDDIRERYAAETIDLAYEYADEEPESGPEPAMTLVERFEAFGEIPF